MKKIVLTYLIILFAKIVVAQNFTGQWKGSFIDNSAAISWGSNKCDYVIDLEVQGTEVTGSSYTYFIENGKRYYTICRIVGTLNLKKKYIEVTETERTKTNVPIEVTNSFQLHKLKWRREAGKEILEGNWQPAPGQNKSVNGFGTTLLSKRQLTEISPLAKKVIKPATPLNETTKKVVKETIVKKNTIATNKPTAIPKPNLTNTNKPIVKAPLQKPTIKNSIVAAPKDTAIKKPIIAKVTTKEKIVPSGFENRSNTILQTVNVENEKVFIELYDNGDVDGDSVSLFYNGKILLAHQRLTAQPIKVELPVNSDEMNELVMYADNLGTIPPNTALMIVMDGKKRYEVRVTSDLKKSGTIRFVHLKKKE
jgi:hypothetical protein